MEELTGKRSVSSGGSKYEWHCLLGHNAVNYSTKMSAFLEKHDLFFCRIGEYRSSLKIGGGGGVTDCSGILIL
jgi:hypothetical protein